MLLGTSKVSSVCIKDLQLTTAPSTSLKLLTTLSPQRIVSLKDAIDKQSIGALNHARSMLTHFNVSKIVTVESEIINIATPIVSHEYKYLEDIVESRADDSEAIIVEETSDPFSPSSQKSDGLRTVAEKSSSAKSIGSFRSKSHIDSVV